LLDRFSGLCDEVRARLDAEFQRLSTPAIRAEDFPDTTSAGLFLRQLPTSDGRKRLDLVLAPLTADESQRRHDLETLLIQAKANDPKKLALAANHKSGRYQSLADRLARIAAALSREKLTRFAAVCADSKKANEAAEVARTKAFTNETLDGVGTDVWKRLWLAARGYAPIAQPDRPFADGSPDARCVLCAQSLTEESARRLATLEAFVKGELQSQAENLRNQATQMLDAVNALPFQQPGDDALLLELEADDVNLAQRCRDFVKAAATLASTVGLHFSEGHPLAAADAPLVAPAGLAVLAATLREQALQYQAAATPTTLAAQQSEFAELDAKARLVARADDVRAEAARHERLALLAAAKQTTATRGVSDLSKDLTKKYVSETLCERFRDEVRRLGLQHLEVELAPVRVEKGTLFHRISLKAKQPAPLRDVISEGEFRCLALAAFLAEVGDSTTGILFDDPVSSLDHTWRERIARRLAEEARSRQVIVFTHDIVFHNLLRDWPAMAAINAPFAERSVERRGTAGVGYCLDSPPWKAMKTKDRIRVLKERLVVLRKQYESGDVAYERDVRDWQGCLREAWERGVEECLLNDAIVRYRGSVNTKPLKRALANIQPGDYAAIEMGMSRTSGELRGHDDSPALNPPIPTPAEVTQDLADFEKWVATKPKT
jgi:cell pole-organizing protein PopZ